MFNHTAVEIAQFRPVAGTDESELLMAAEADDTGIKNAERVYQ